MCVWSFPAQDEAYTDWFGFSPNETVGKDLSAFVVHADDVSRYVTLENVMFDFNL